MKQYRSGVFRLRAESLGEDKPLLDVWLNQWAAQGYLLRHFERFGPDLALLIMVGEAPEPESEPGEFAQSEELEEADAPLLPLQASFPLDVDETAPRSLNAQLI